MSFIPSTTTKLPKRTRATTTTTTTTTPLHTPRAGLSRREALKLPLLLPLLPLLPRRALADRTYVAAKRSYERYHPRILSALETLAAIQPHVRAGDAAAAGALIADKAFDVKARRAFSIYATGFSDNYLGPQSRAMLKSADAMFKELAFVARGEDMELHYGNAVQRARDYYREARLPESEIAALGI